MKNWIFLNMNGSVLKDNIMGVFYDNFIENNGISEVLNNFVLWFYVS